MKIKYWVAKYIDDVFRDEPVNIGVFAKIENEAFGKFFGESLEDGVVDGRKVRRMYPDVYKQWIKFWRRKLTENDFESIINHKGTNYKVTEGGEISRVEGDEPIDIINYLYSIIVSEGGFKEAMGEEEGGKVRSFTQDLENVFSQKKLFDAQIYKHPIRSNIPIDISADGTGGIKFTPAFTQVNGKSYLIDMADFTQSSKKVIRDHAGYLAYFFSSLRRQNSNKYEPIALVKVEDADKDNEYVVNGLSFLKNEGKVVDWLNLEERNKFLQEREEIAKS